MATLEELMRRITKRNAKKYPPYPKKLASERIRYHMKHLERHPGGRKQAIAIGLSEARRQRTLGITRKSLRDVQDAEDVVSKRSEKWIVHEGRPSWHQQRAGHISAASSVFSTKHEAERYVRSFRKYHPNETIFIQPPARKR